MRVVNELKEQESTGNIGIRNLDMLPPEERHGSSVAIMTYDYIEDMVEHNIEKVRETE